MGAWSAARKGCAAWEAQAASKEQLHPVWKEWIRNATVLGSYVSSADSSKELSWSIRLEALNWVDSFALEAEIEGVF